jgi:hypothetical protein
MTDLNNMKSTSSLNSITTISSNQSIQSNKSECFICNEEREEPAMSLMDYEINRTCQCAAKLHGQCYSQWLSQSKTCPICRNPILVDTIISVVNEEIEPIPETILLQENNEIENTQNTQNTETIQNKYGLLIVFLYISIVIITIAIITMISIL